MYVCACVEEIRFPKSVISVKTREKMRGREEGKRGEGMWKKGEKLHHLFFCHLRSKVLDQDEVFSTAHVDSLPVSPSTLQLAVRWSAF